MASESEGQEPVPQAAADPPLVCAPCWICLEDGPDEAGEPLVRDCTCRGETSAGYHLSCIIKYATAKTDKLLSDESNKDVPFSMADLCRSDFTKVWRACPNCCQCYNESISKSIAQALVKLTDDRNLPRTHFVWFEARVFYADSLLFCCRSGTDIVSARQQIEFLLGFVEKEYSKMAAEWWGDEGNGQFVKEWQTGKLLVMLGGAHKIFGTTLKAKGIDRIAVLEYSSTLSCYEKALRNFKSASCRVNPLVPQIRETEDLIQNIKFELGLISVDQRIENIRKELEALEQSGEDGIGMVICKSGLCEALISNDPPEYIEAIKLQGEISTWLERAIGPEHDIVLDSKSKILDTKQDYRNFLKAL